MAGIASKDQSLLETQFRSSINLLPIGVYATDHNGTIIYYNTEAANIWGRSPLLNDKNEIKYCGAYKLYDKNNVPIDHEDSPMALAIKAGASIKNDEVIIEREDGTKINVNISIDPIFFDGKVNGAVNIFYDIEQRKRLDEKQAMLASIVQSSNDAIISKTLNGDITSWNKGAEQIFGYKEDEILGKNIRTLIPKDRWIEEEYILSKIRSGEKVEHYNTIRKKKGGELINISITISPIINSKNEIIGASKIARDVTKEAMIQQKLEEYNEKLKQTINYKDEFLSLVSHELKTPLACSLAFTQLLKFGKEDVNQTYSVQIQKHLKILDKTINDLLDLNRIKEGRLRFNPEPVIVADIVKEAVLINESISDTHAIDLQVECTTLILGDRIRLLQVLNNVLQNAIKYSPDADKVVVKCFESSENVIVTIRDFGIGIAKSKEKIIFKKFHRIDENDQNITGLGIGLYLAKSIIKRHNGKIKVQKPKDKIGSIFKIVLPKNPHELIN